MIEDGAKGRSGLVSRVAGVIPIRARQTSGRFAILDEVHRYWEALRGERLVPLRSEIDPRGIEGALDSAFIVERIAPGIARFRLAGTYLVDLMGAEVRGMPLSVMFTPESRQALAEAVEGVFSGPETARLTLSGERGLARQGLSAQMTLLPLRSDLGDVSRALGCLAADGPIGRAPRRLVIRSVERVDVLGGRPAPGGSAAPASRLVLGASRVEAEPIHPAPARGAIPQRTQAASAGSWARRAPGAPHLRLVERAD